MEIVAKWLLWSIFIEFRVSGNWNDSDSSKPMSFQNATLVLKNILEGYKHEIAPIENDEPINVSINLYINDMVPISKADLHFSLDCYLRISWMDRRLAFNGSEDEYVPFDSKIADHIWSPNLYFPKGKSGYIHSLIRKNIFVKFHPSGTVYFSERISLISFCPMEMGFYPFDIQKCQLVIEDYSYPRTYVRLRWMDPATEKSQNLYTADFNKIVVKANPPKSRIGDFKLEFDRLTLDIELYRDIKLYILRDFLPCILIVMMSWVTFWINHNSVPARVCLGITTVLTTVSIINNIQKISPATKTLRSLDVYLLMCLLFVFGALLELALVGMTDRHSKEIWKKLQKRKQELMERKSREIAEQEDNIMQTTQDVPTFVSNETCDDRSNADSTRPWNRKKKSYDLAPSASDTKFDENCQEKKEKPVTFVGPLVFKYSEHHIVDTYSKILFPISFLVFNAVFFIYHRVNPNTVD